MKQKRSYKKPSFYVISSAMDGDKISIDKILDFYDPYISKSCIRPLYDEYGNVVENVIYKNGELFRSFKWQYIYNEFGLIETRSYYVDDMLSWVEKNEYSQK